MFGAPACSYLLHWKETTMNRSIALAIGLAALLGCAHAPAAKTTEADMSKVDEQSLQLELEVRGEGPPLVLMGGGLTGKLGWEPHMPKLTAERKVYRAQQLMVQYGLENRPLPPGHSLRMESEALARALKAHGLEGPVDVVAWSFGAAVCLDFALNHPERIRTLTLVEPPAFWVLDATGRLDAQSARERKELAELNATMREDVNEEQLISFVRQVGLVPPGKTPQSLPQWPVWYQHRRSLRGNDAPLDHKDVATRLIAFQAPVLLVKGTGSSHFLHAIIDVLADTLPNASVIELPGGHAPHLVAMDRFLSELADFKRAQPRQRAANAR
jgi:pimeloyl-ACP methyl ester carboxylesterase